MKHLGIELALGREFETNDLRSKDLSYIADVLPGPSLQHQNPNRDTRLLETELNNRKQKTGTQSNRDKTRLFSRTFSSARVSRSFNPPVSCIQKRREAPPIFVSVRTDSDPLFSAT
jgi:hypothetical protein